MVNTKKKNSNKKSAGAPLVSKNVAKATTKTSVKKTAILGSRSHELSLEKLREEIKDLRERLELEKKAREQATKKVV